MNYLVCVRGSRVGTRGEGEREKEGTEVVRDKNRKRLRTFSDRQRDSEKETDGDRQGEIIKKER